MIKRHLYPVRICVLLVLVSCLVQWLVGCNVLYNTNQHTPSATNPGDYSATTALSFLRYTGPNALFNLQPYSGYRDNAVWQISQSCPPDSGGKVYYRRAATMPNRRQYVLPPGVYIPAGGNFALDEVETTNLEWQHFLNVLAADSGQFIARRYLPNMLAQPRPDYFTNPFYREYPVVGISRQQVDGFCRWRSAVVSGALNQSLDQNSPAAAPHHVWIQFRLPTEAEWEYAAGGLTGFPHGSYCPTRRVAIWPEAAAYLKERSHSTMDANRIKQDIKQFNQSKPTLVWLNCRRDVPYFLQSDTPEYAYGTMSLLGFFHMLGNVAEMIQEPGVTKGGSYRDELADCTIKGRGVYTGPAPTIGFRCACDITFPTR